MKKKLLVLNTSIILGVGSLISIPSVSADYSSQIQQVEKNINDAESKLSLLKEKIKKTDIAILDNDRLIVQTENDVKVMQDEIRKLQGEISVLNETITKRTEVLKKRAQSFQESGGKVSYLEVLLGSVSFTDFIDRVFTITQIANSDSDLIQQHEQDKKAVEEKQLTVNQRLVELTENKTELEGMKTLLLEQKEQNDSLKKDLEEALKGDKVKLRELETQIQVEQEAQRAAKQAATSKPITQKSIKSRVEDGKAVDMPSVNNGTLNTILTSGHKYFGNSVYVFGGGRTEYDIANGRFDCSAFVSWAFRQAGISIGASTEVLRTQGKKISFSEARPGDLVFFDTYKRDGHVAIYLGGGKFIGSQSSTGVAIASMNSGYYQKTFKGHVRRVANF